MQVRWAVGQALAIVLATAALAQSRDPLHSPECDAAREVLERALDDASRKGPGATGRLATARQDAIEMCLGREPGERTRSGAPDPPVAVAPPVMQVPRAPPIPAVVASPPPPVYVPPAVVTTCDTTGCWDSSGRRINSQGPLLVGPRGACLMVGGIVQCP
ncbi:MAG TPA: hypothetical protein VMZ74_16620 [Ramlibacter sp.]|nr:hypothetical protein [Ramlibacter sp.]